MNYYGASKLADGSGWHYTCTNDGRTWPVGYCGRYRKCDCGGLAPQPVENPDCEKCGDTGAIRVSDEEFEAHVHATAEEARECYRTYLLDEATFREGPANPDTLHRCEFPGCDEMTAGTASVDHSPIYLCEEHRNRDSLDQFYPDVGTSVASW